MKSVWQYLVALIWVTSSQGIACGPFFPDTVLDMPQSALRVRASCLLDEMIAIDRALGSGLSRSSHGLAMVKRTSGNRLHDGSISQEELDRDALREILEPVIAAGMPVEIAMRISFGSGQTQIEMVDLATRMLEKQVAPGRVEEILKAVAAWRTGLAGADYAGPFDIAVPGVAEVPAPPGFPEIAADVRAYWKAAHAFHEGDLAKARDGWQAVLQMPEHRERAVWAAWMLAKTSRTEPEAHAFYQETVRLAGNGCRDAIGLVPLARGWLAWHETDPVEALRMYFEATCSGDEDMLVSLRQQLPRLFAAGNDALARAAADPLVREIVTALLFSAEYGPLHQQGETGRDSLTWLAQLEKHPSPKASLSAAKAAWISYGRGDFESVRRWLSQSPADAPEVVWLEAKLALRDGHLDRAARLFAKAAPFYQFDGGRCAVEPQYAGLSWFHHAQRRDWMRGQFHSDRAIVHIGRGEFLRAMGFLAQAGYHDDASYLAERVLTTDELVSWIRKYRPPSKEDAGPVRLDADGRPQGEEEVSDVDPLRYVLARRLAREFRFREAEEFMPTSVKPVFKHYVRLHREARSGGWSLENQAAILWNLALLRRHLGMELFGYEGAPDNTRYYGAFPPLDFAARRQWKDGWSSRWTDVGMVTEPASTLDERAVPRTSREELSRLIRLQPRTDLRFHYRYERGRSCVAGSRPFAGQ